MPHTVTQKHPKARRAEDHGKKQECKLEACEPKQEDGYVG